VAYVFRERFINTERISPSDSQQILAEQRKRRPVSPHLSIYRLQINYITSPLHRITGAVVSGGLYCFGAAYLAAPLFGWHLDSTSIVATFAAWPLAAKVATKFALAWPVTFHCINGVGHLVWDTGRRLTSKQIVRQGWTIVGLSFAGAVYLATMV
jgi:succinate dehydrogenase (ubiquinone) cytochrome b560 subunit